MRFRLTALTAAVSLLAVPAAARAATHVVVPGETLSGIAAANRLSTQALAGANSLAADAFVIAGRSLVVPAPGTTAAAVAGTALPAPLGGYRVRLGDSLSAIAAEHGVSLSQLAAANGVSPEGVLVAGTSLRLPGGGGSTVTSGAPATASPGSHLVNPGETLIGVAQENGLTPAALAAANGLTPDAHIIAGTRLRVPAGAAAAGAPVTSSAAGGPVATGGRLTAGQIGSIAAQHGAPASLATAIAWQESGFNNNMVSVANARGIMQVMPSTWDYVQRSLASGPLDPASPTDNVRAGSLLLGQLLRDTGDPATAVAAYYQGLGSVRRIGMLPETRQYVANVLALRSRFGG
jgi:LysM repeat protein